MTKSLLQTSDLAYMRSQIELALPDLVHVQRKTLVSDQQGGFTEEFDNAYQNIPARLTARSGSESVLGGNDSEQTRREVLQEFTLTVRSDQSIEQTDRIFHSSGTYEVQFVNNNAAWAITKQCQLRKI